MERGGSSSSRGALSPCYSSVVPVSSDRRQSSTAPSLSSRQGHRQQCPPASLLHPERLWGCAGLGSGCPGGCCQLISLWLWLGNLTHGSTGSQTARRFSFMYGERCLANLEGAAFVGAWGHCRRWLLPHMTKRRKASWVPSQGSKQVCCQKPGIRDSALGNFVSVCVFSQVFL